jgi:hypothetical protein
LPATPLEVALAGAVFDIIVLVKLETVIVLTLGLLPGLNRKTSLSELDRLLAIGSSDIFTSAITNIYLIRQGR